MDLVEYYEPSEWGGDGIGDGPGHAAAEELLQGTLDSARIHSFHFILMVFSAFFPYNEAVGFTTHDRPQDCWSMRVN
jgi:hypothetical protein